MGGAVGIYGFSSVSDAQSVAQFVWNAYLGGSNPSVTRPLGATALDGIDLDLEGGSPLFYSDFVIAIRGLMKTSSKKYFITAAPQCPFPDAWTGPGGGTALGDAIANFDYIWVQFYNNYCQYNGGTSSLFPVSCIPF